MEQNHQSTREEVKAGNVVFRPEDVNYPQCSLHKADAHLVPKNDKGWMKYSNHILKCPRCISNKKLDINEFKLLDEVFEE